MFRKWSCQEYAILKEAKTELYVKLECVAKFCYLGTHVPGGSFEEASRARMRSVWAKFRLPSHVLTARGAPYKGNDIKTIAVIAVGVEFCRPSDLAFASILIAYHLS